MLTTETFIETILKGLGDFDDLLNQTFQATDDGGTDLSINIPGVNPSDLSIDATAKTLTISVKNKVIRSYRLGPSVDLDKITAKAEYGVLTLKVPRKDTQEPAARKIPVE